MEDIDMEYLDTAGSDIDQICKRPKRSEFKIKKFTEYYTDK